MCFSFFMSFHHSPSVALLIQKEYSGVYTKTHIALWRGGNTFHGTTWQTPKESKTSSALYTSVFTVKMIRASQGDTHEFMMPPHPHHE